MSIFLARLWSKAGKNVTGCLKDKLKPKAVEERTQVVEYLSSNPSFTKINQQG
jgi:hypothetical protein